MAVKQTERAEQIMARRQAGETLASIGRGFGITRERVRQILAKNGGDPWHVTGVTAVVRQMILEGRSIDEIAACTDRRRQQINQIIYNIGLAETHGAHIQTVRRHQEIVDRYNQGVSRHDLAVEYNMTQTNLGHILRQHGIRERGLRLKPDFIEAIRPSIEHDLQTDHTATLTAIGKRHGVSWNTVRNIREKMNARNRLENQ